MTDRQRQQVLIRFGEKLLEVRKKKKLSYRKMALQCDIDYSDIKKYEKGEKDLRLATIVELAVGLGIHPKELLDFEVDSISK